MPLTEQLWALIGRSRPAAKTDTGLAYAPEPQPLPAATSRSPDAWRGFFRNLASDTELLVLACVLAGLSGWFLLSVEPAAKAGRQQAVAPSTPPATAPPEEPFVLVSARARDWLLPAMLAFEPRQPSQPLPDEASAVATAPAMATASVEQHALVAEPLFDPLGSVVLTGLPGASRLSAGAELTAPGASSSDWAVAFGDLDNLVVSLPRDRNGPVRTRLDLLTRAGVKIASLTLEVREDGAVPNEVGDLAKPAQPQLKPKVRPAKSSSGSVKLPRKSVKTAAKSAAGPPPVYPGDTPKGAPPPPGPSKPPPGLASALPLGFLSPDPKDSAASGLPPHLRDDPRFTTLRGLGMSPGDPVPAADPPGTGP